MATPEERARSRAGLIDAAARIGLPAEFGELMCDHPGGQARLKGITA